VITFILAVRDRLEHAVHSLPSLASQAAACGGELIVVDQDSGVETAEFLQLACATLGGKYVRLDRGDPFSRSWTLNVGAKMAKMPLLSFCDVDVVVDDNFAEVIARVFSEVFHSGPCVINCFPYQVDKEASDRFKSAGDMSVLRDGDHRPWWTLGAGSHVDTRSFLRIGGFDEAYDGWGCEDDDLFQRLRATGCGWSCPAPTAKCWHLWHAPPPRKDEHEPPNRARLAKSVERIAAGDLIRNNGRAWGETAWSPIGGR